MGVRAWSLSRQKIEGDAALAASLRARPIWKSIAGVDGACMDAIESGSHAAFLEVLERTGNTVCGRHPIGVVMAGVEGVGGRDVEGGDDDGDDDDDDDDDVVDDGNNNNKKDKDEEEMKFRFVRYERSEDVVSIGQSSVSYCSAFARVSP